MPTFIFKGAHSDAVISLMTPPGPDRLAEWASQACDGSGDVHLVSRPECKVRVVHLRDLARQDRFWTKGEPDTFSATADIIEAEVQADSAAGCYDVLKKHLFRLRPDSGRADFVVAVGSDVPSDGVKVVELIPPFLGDHPFTETLAVLISPEQGGPQHWKESTPED